LKNWEGSSVKRVSDNNTWKELQMISGLRDQEQPLRDISCRGPVRVALVYPNLYDVASASLSYHDLFYRMNIPSDTGCERFFYSETGGNYFSLDSTSVVSDFRIWAFSVHFELDLLNVLFMLRDLGVPLSPHERSEHHPIILIGGALSLFMRPVLELVADYVHEGELSQGFVDRLASLKLEKHTRDSAVDYLRAYEDDKLRTSGKTLADYAESAYLTPKSVFPNRFLMEISRGCRHRCAFCVVGHRFGRVRHVPFESIKRSIESVVDFTNKIGLVAAEVNDHPDIDSIAQYSLENDLDISVSSLRASSLSERLMRALKQGSQKQFTIAPEGGSQKVRNLLRKGLNDSDIYAALEVGRKVGFNRVKLYFIFGVPGEDEGDLEEIASFVSACRRIGYSSINVSLNPLVPKPGTPFEFSKMITAGELRRKKKLLSTLLNVTGVKADFESIRESTVQYAVANMNEEIFEGLASIMTRSGKREVFQFLINQSLTISGKRKEWVRNGKEEHTCC